MGLQMINFRGVAIYVEGGSYNVIGGDRTIGAGPIGRGNMVSYSFAGIDLLASAGGNIITGNILENLEWGIIYEGDPPHNPVHTIIGPDNIISRNKSGGIRIDSVWVNVTITANSIYDNEGPGINYTEAGATAPPVILYFDLATGTVNGSTCKDCVVEVFSTDKTDGKVYEGTVTADVYGNFSFNKGEALSGPFLTATTTSPGENTSEFSQPTSARSAIQIALDFIQSDAPTYQTSFDTWEFGDPVENVKVENVKLIVTSVNQAYAGVTLSDFSSDRFAVEFDVRNMETSPEGHCIFGTSTNDRNDKTRRSNTTGFYSMGTVSQSHWVYPDGHLDIEGAISNINTSISNNALLIYLGDQVAAFINGKLAYIAHDSLGSAIYSYHSLSANYTIRCEYDNYKIWDLSAVDFSGTTGTSVVTPTANVTPITPNASLPAWVTAFAQPILDAIASRSPDFQDDFHDTSGGWSIINCAAWRMKYVDGELVVTVGATPGTTVGTDVCRIHRNNINYPNFVMELDGRFLPGSVGSSEWKIYFRTSGSAASAHQFGIISDGGGTFIRMVNDTAQHFTANSQGNQTDHLLLIAEDTKFAFYLNGQPLYYTENNSYLPYGDFLLGVRNNNPSQGDTIVAFDNFKIWDISDLSIP